MIRLFPGLVEITNVNLENSTTNTPDMSPISPEKVDWNAIVENIVELDKILRNDSA